MVEIFPNLESLLFSGDFSYIKDVWPSSHFTKLHSLSTPYYSPNTCMIPLSTNGYRELHCKPELIAKGIKGEIFKPQRILILTLNMHECMLDGEKFGMALVKHMKNLSSLEL